MRSFLRGIQVLVSLTPLVVGFLRDQRRWIIVGPPARRTERHHRRRAKKLVARMAKQWPMLWPQGRFVQPRKGPWSAAGAALGGPTGRPLLARRKGPPDIRDSGRVFRGQIREHCG